MRKRILITILTVIFVGGLVTIKTLSELTPLPTTLMPSGNGLHKFQVLDRRGVPLTITYQNDLNIHDWVALHNIPELLQQIFIVAEDKRFFEHHGIDWQARMHAVLQNLKALRIVRGASTLTEQTVRILYPRPRTFWSRWLESFESARLEKHFSKADILEFYLNQVPYASQRRGVVQAARYYFDRDLDTLNLKEMIALAVLVRSPSRLDLRRGTVAIEKPTHVLAQRLQQLGIISQQDYETVLTAPLELHDFDLPLQATHFVNYIYTLPNIGQWQQAGRLHSTLDATLQEIVQKILDRRLINLRTQGVHNGAVLVLDHQRHEILAWVNGGELSPQVPGSQIDAILTPRQPGSTLKPFLYAIALEKGWTAATLINDAPLTKAVGQGMHNFRNYSRSYYGWVRLRDALGNSLNTPAVRTIQFVGPETFLQRLRQLGMKSLTASSDFYGEGLALGNGGVTLLELTQAYAALASRGVFHPSRVLLNILSTNVFSLFTPEVSSIIADILSDPDARSLEFGRGALLRFPVQTAVKTGTSTDYRDAWAMGFNHRYTVGVWLGNLDQQPMSQVSGSSGAALVLRSVFAELNRHEETNPLFLSPKLVKAHICRDSGRYATPDCPSRIEWFVADTEPAPLAPIDTPVIENPRLAQPSDGLQLAMDPRIPDSLEAFALVIEGTPPDSEKIEWLMDGEVVGTTLSEQHHFLWPISRGTHTAQARIWQAWLDQPLLTPMVTFYVK